MEYNSAWRIINSDPYLFQRYSNYRYPRKGISQVQKVKAFFYEIISTNDYWLKKYQADVESHAPTVHNNDSIIIAKMIREWTWLRFRGALVRAVDVLSHDDEEIKKKIRKLPGQVIH